MSEDKPTMTDCYVAFLDLMGVRNLVKKATEDVQLCEKVVSALKEAKNTSTFWREKRDIELGNTTRWQLQVQAFSDCVALFIPTESKMLSWLLASVRRMHDRLLRLGIPLRGGITVGGMHWEQDWDNPVTEADNERLDSLTPVAFGPGLVSAYDLEDATAVYPRILISEALYDHVEQEHGTSNPFPLGDGRLLDYFRQDFDGLRHFDVIHRGINRKDVVEVREREENGERVVEYVHDETSYADWLGVVKEFIVTGRESVNGEKLEAKYLWLGHYYNSKVADTDGATLIRWFEDVVPDGAIRLTVRQHSEE